MKSFISALALLAASAPAHAFTVAIDTNLPSDATFFNSYVGDSGTFSTSIGTFSGNGVVYAAGTNIAGVAASTTPGAAFMGVTGDETLTLKSAVTSFSLLWGSADVFNTLELGSTVVPGATINGLMGTVSEWVTVSGFAPTNTIEWRSSQPAFEYSLQTADPIGAPEASTWAMMLIGFAGLGFAARRRRETMARVI